MILLEKHQEKPGVILWTMFNVAFLLVWPFTTFMFEAWVQVQIRANDYMLSQIGEEKTVIAYRLDEVKSEFLQLDDFATLAAKANELGFHQPAHGQFQIVKLEETIIPEEKIPESPYAIASLQEAPPAAAGGEQE